MNRAHLSVKIGAAILPKVQVGKYVQRRFKSVCKSAQSDQSLSFPPEEMLNPQLPIDLPSDAQADLSLRCVHMPTRTLHWTPTQTFAVLFYRKKNRNLSI